jgi:hypothetical protein
LDQDQFIAKVFRIGVGLGVDHDPFPGLAQLRSHIHGARNVLSAAGAESFRLLHDDTPVPTVANHGRLPWTSREEAKSSAGVQKKVATTYFLPSKFQKKI